MQGSGEDDPGNTSTLSFIQEKPLTHLRKSKYDDDQGGQTWTHESSDISEGEIPKLPVGKWETD